MSGRHGARWGSVWNSTDYPPGKCVACDRPIPERGTGGKSDRARSRLKNQPESFKRRVTCGDPRCMKTYYQLRRSRRVELGLEPSRRERSA